MGKNRELDVSHIFSLVLLIVGGSELMTIEDPSLSAHVVSPSGSQYSFILF